MAEKATSSEERVQRIMSRARSETAVRDLVGFGVGRIWLVLLELFAIAYKALNRSAAERETWTTQTRTPDSPA